MTENQNTSMRPEFGSHTGFGLVLKSSRGPGWRRPLWWLVAFVLAAATLYVYWA